MSILIGSLNLLFLVGLVWWLWRQEWENSLRPYFFPTLLLKLGCGLLLGVVSFYVLEKGDTFLYFGRAQLMLDVASEQGLGTYLRYLLFNDATNTRMEGLQRPFYESAWNMAKLFSIPMVLTQGNYFISSLYLSLFSFAGLWFLVNAITRYFPATALPALIAFLFFPSVMYWGAGVTKESFQMGGMGMMLGSFLHLLFSKERRHQILYLLLLVLGVYVVWLVKYFVAVALALLLVLSLLLKVIFYSQLLGRFHWALKLLVLLLLFSAVAYVGLQLNPNLYPEALPEAVYDNHQKSLRASVGKPRIDFPYLEPTYLSFALHSQLAMAGILFRPFIWEVYNLRSLLAALENTMLLVLVFGFLRDLFQENRWKWQHGYFLIAILVYVFVLGTLLAYSMPNLGTLSRYRIVILPFVVFLLLLCDTNNTLLQRFSLKRKYPEKE